MNSKLDGIKFTAELWDAKEQVYISTATYSNGRLAIMLSCCEDGSPFMKLSVNIPEENIKPNQFFVKNDEGGKEVAEQLAAATNLIRKVAPERVVRTMYVSNYATLWEVV